MSDTENQTTETTPIVDVEILENESFINNALTKFDASAAYIAEQKALATALTIAGIADKEGYKSADRNRKDLKQKRLEVANKKKELIDLPKKFIAAIKAHAEPIEEALKQIEAIYQTKTDVIDKLQAEADRVEQERLQKLFVGRTQELIDIGFLFNGKVYVLGTSIHMPSEIQNATDEAWTTILANGKDVAAAIKKQKDEDEAKERELAELRAKLAAAQAPVATPAPLPTERVNGTPTPAAAPAIKLPPPVAAPAAASTYSAPITHPTNPGAANIATDPADEPQAAAAGATVELPSAIAWNALNIPTSPNTPHMKAGFAKGWDAALDAAITALNSPDIKTRGDIKNAISNLKIKQ
jgi:hypothetical protein